MALIEMEYSRNLPCKGDRLKALAFKQGDVREVEYITAVLAGSQAPAWEPMFEVLAS